jgi:hypothetical protein
MRTQSIVLAALLGAVAFADPSLKQALGKSKQLAQVQQLDCGDITATADPLDPITVVEPDLEWCECDETLPELGAGVQVSNSLLATVNQVTSVSSTPDVE